MNLSLFDAISYVVAYLLAIWGGHLFVKAFLAWIESPGDSGIRRAGALIGYLERVLILTFVLLGQYVAIPIVLTAKSITRFEELKERKFAEYYLIGTLSSMLFSILIGLGLLLFLRKL